MYLNQTIMLYTLNLYNDVCQSFLKKKKLEKTEKNAHSSTVDNSQTQAIPYMSPSRWIVVYSPSEVLCSNEKKHTTNIHNLGDSWNIIFSQRTSLKRIFSVRLTCKFQSRWSWYEVWGREEWQARTQVLVRSYLSIRMDITPVCSLWDNASLLYLGLMSFPVCLIHFSSKCTFKGRDLGEPTERGEWRGTERVQSDSKVLACVTRSLESPFLRCQRSEEKLAWVGEGKSSSVLDRLWRRCWADYQGGYQEPTYIVKSGAQGKVRLEMLFGSVSPVDRLQGHEPGWSLCGREEGGSRDRGDRRALKHLAWWGIRATTETQGQPEEQGGNQVSVLSTGHVVSRRREGPTVSEAAERSRWGLRIDHWIQQCGGHWWTCQGQFHRTGAVTVYLWRGTVDMEEEGRQLLQPSHWVDVEDRIALYLVLDLSSGGQDSSRKRKLSGR